MRASVPHGIYFLIYHKVSGELPLELDLPFDLFRRQMEFLHRTRSVVPYDEAVARLRRREDLAHDQFVLTFDDGYGDFWTHAAPVLHDFQLPATVFITMGPAQATGSWMGFPETRRNRIPCSPACTEISSPVSKSTSERLPTSERTVSSVPAISVFTGIGFEAPRKAPDPSKM